MIDDIGRDFFDPFVTNREQHSPFPMAGETPRRTSLTRNQQLRILPPRASSIIAADYKIPVLQFISSVIDCSVPQLPRVNVSRERLFVASIEHTRGKQQEYKQDTPAGHGIDFRVVERRAAITADEASACPVRPLEPQLGFLLLGIGETNTGETNVKESVYQK
jgi:hypothetical protein